MLMLVLKLRDKACLLLLLLLLDEVGVGCDVGSGSAAAGKLKRRCCLMEWNFTGHYLNLRVNHPAFSKKTHKLVLVQQAI